MVGLAFLHGPHHVAQKSSNTTLPLRLAFVTVLPSVDFMLKAGAALPSKLLVLFCTPAVSKATPKRVAPTNAVLIKFLFMALYNSNVSDPLRVHCWAKAGDNCP